MQDISELRDRVAALPALEKRMRFLLSEIKKVEEEASALIRQYKQESRDVDKLQKESLSAFILKTFGKYEDKLEKERREEIAAKLSYDRASSRLHALNQEKDALDVRIADLRREARAYESELKTDGTQWQRNSQNSRERVTPNWRSSVRPSSLR